MSFNKWEIFAELFEKRVETQPHNVAVIFPPGSNGRHEFSYGELEVEVAQKAARLREEGFKPGDIAGIMVDDTIEMVVALLGVIRAGGSPLPIDPENSVIDIRTVLEAQRASMLLTETGGIEKYSVIPYATPRSIKRKPLVTPPRTQMRNLDSTLPIIDRSLINYEKHNKYIGLSGVKNSMVLQGTRGCPYLCLYCHKIWPKIHITRSAENIFKEMELLYNLGIKRFSLIDDVFNLNVKNSSRFLEMVIKNGMQLQMFFPNGFRGDILTKDFIDLLVEAGTVNMGLSLETASPRLQKLICKNLDIQRFEENVAYLCRKHPQVILYINFMHGFPTETEEEARMTMDFIKRMKWIHFPYLHILKIYQDTGMEKMALENGISQEAILRSANLGYHELPETLPFDKSFSLQYQTELLNDYFLSRERLLHILPFQMKILTEEELVSLYNAYLAVDITSLNDILEFTGISRKELGDVSPRDEDYMVVPDLNKKLEETFHRQEPSPDALKLLILDLSTFFSDKKDVFYDMIEPPLGPLYVLTYLNDQMKGQVNGKIAKSRIDFDNYEELRELLKQFQPDIIGIRSLTYYKKFFHQIVGLMRQWGVSVPIVTGGPYASSDYERILQDDNIDIVVLGEGEMTFCELIREIFRNDGKLPGEEVLKKIPGLAFIPTKEKYQGRHALELKKMNLYVEHILAEITGEDILYLTEAGKDILSENEKERIFNFNAQGEEDEYDF